MNVVLVVDDRPDVAALASEMVESLGYRVRTAHTGLDALRIIQEDTTVSLLFSDVVMPGMNGVQLARAAKKRRPDLGVILTSGFTESTIEKSDADGTPFDFIAKPYRMAALAQKISLAIGEPA